MKDHLGRPLVAVTGIGMISALGRGLKAHVEGLQRPTTALAPLTMFTTAGVVLGTRLSKLPPVAPVMVVFMVVGLL